MNIEEKLTESHKTLSKIMAPLMTIIFVVTIYIVQRSLSVIGGSPRLLEDLIYGENRQINLYSLEFSYRTMTIMWPGVLGALCVVYYLLERKRNQIEISFNEIKTSKKIDISYFDPFYIPASLFKSKITRLIGQYFATFPLLAIGSHLMMIFMWLYKVGWEAQKLTLSNDLYSDKLIMITKGAVFSLTSILSNIIGFIGAFLFYKTINNKINTSISFIKTPNKKKSHVHNK